MRHLTRAVAGFTVFAAVLVLALVLTVALEDANAQNLVRGRYT